ncbi:MAG: hypothetical protein ACLQVA_17180 [Candidatus Brocadiia bacterium]
MADQIPAQPGPPGQVPPEKAAQSVPPSESERGALPEKIAPVPSVEDSDEPLQGPSAGPPAEPPAPSPSAEAESQAPEGAPVSQENFPCPFDEDIGYEIVEPPEGEESDDGFASIPAGPTEEVNYEPPRVRGPRRRGDRGRRPPVRAEAPAQEKDRAPAVKRFPIWLAVAGVVLAAAIIIVVVLLARGGR